MPLSRVLFIVLLSAFFLFEGCCSSVVHEQGHAECSAALKAWEADTLQEPDSQKHELKELLYFLHIPRTGGRTYHHCLLRHLYSKEQHCDSSYDKFRFNSSTHCRLLVTHDDYSVLRKLSAVSTSVVTNLRHPVDRIFSAYEFSIEVAARFLLRKPTLNPGKGKAEKAAKSKGVSTLDIWPWSVLVPWMRQDLFIREKARQLGLSVTPGEFSHYNASAFAMPLHEFVHHPIAKEILHNGAVFQIAGLTNNSYIKGAEDLRKCAIDHPDLGSIILNVAKRRVDNMIFVGFTEKHDESAKLFAHIVGGQILPLGVPSHGVLENDHSHSQQDTSSGISETSTPASNGNLTVYGLIEKYENCASRLHSTQVQRRVNSLNALPVNFSTEARLEVDEDTLNAIRLLNSLDLELYEYAQNIFSGYRQTLETRKSPREIKVDDNLSQDYQPQRFSFKWMLVIVMVLCLGGILTLVGGLRILKVKRQLRYHQPKVHDNNVHKRI